MKTWPCAWLNKEEWNLAADSPWGAGYPFVGQPKGYLSVPKSVYSCSMPNHKACSLTFSITFLQLARWLVSIKQRQKHVQLVCHICHSTVTEPKQKCKKCTCRQAVVFKDFAQDQFVGVESEWIPEHAHRDEVHVAVGTFRLVCARAIKVPLRNIW